MSVDSLTLGIGFASFGLFLLVQIPAFRKIGQENLLKVLKSMLIAFSAVPVVWVGGLSFYRVLDISWQAQVCMVLLALWIYLLLCFIYVFNVWGVYESSVRMRLLREIARAQEGGISKEEILQNYNSEIMVKLRLQRLLGSGEIIEQKGGYKLSNRKSAFLIFYRINSDRH